jgi:hypothetical protein
MVYFTGRQVDEPKGQIGQQRFELDTGLKAFSRSGCL